MPTRLEVGVPAPDLPLLLPDGSTWRPGWREGRATVLAFHRHLA